MGRNLIPKLDEWRDGEMYQFRHVDDTDIINSNDGKMVVYTYRKGKDGVEQVLATAWADGLQELMAAMYEAGLQKGKIQGASDARTEICRALGIKTTALETI